VDGRADGVVVPPEMTKKLALAVLGAAILMPLLASARHAVVPDPDDTRGLLDIKRAEMLPGSPQWRVKTWLRWNEAELWDRGYALVYIDTFASDRSDYYALVRSNGRRLVASLYRDRQQKRDFRIRSIRARHPRGNILTVAVPMEKLRRRDSRIFRWYTLTMLSGRRCKTFCFDRAPDTGAIAEPGPGPTPTLPTPAPTVTP